MLFNSFEFIFLFFPFTLFGFYLIQEKKPSLLLPWLVITSLFFYAWWYPPFLILLLISIVVNYLFGLILGHFQKKIVLVVGLMFNIGFIAYYKYFDFLINNINFIFNQHFQNLNLFLPLAISFFTFQQISYLVDTYKQTNYKYTFLEYCFFVSFFPQLIAGPIVQHKDIIPQIKGLRFNQKNLHIGLCYFVLGLAKKVLIADQCATYANPIFQATESGMILSISEAWMGTLAYSFQLYFDFSGYSDMAIGLARVFNVKLPINFNSPYKSKNIIEFWRRWHITLSTFLRDYLYIPLGGNKKGKTQQYSNLMLTMIIGGFWHGANWTFVLWGSLHGLYLCVNHSIKSILPNFQINKFFSIILTFVFISFAWVYFRANTISQANSIIKSMLGINGLSFAKRLSEFLRNDELISFCNITFNGFFPNELFDHRLGSIIILFSILATCMPNTHQILRFNNNFRVLSNMNYLILSRSVLSAIGIGLIGAIAILFVPKANEFLYFQF